MEKNAVAEVTDDQQAELDLSNGFSMEAPTSEKVTVAAIEKKPVEDQEAPKVEAPAPVPPLEPEASKPEYVQLTKEQFNAIMGSVEKTTALASDVRKLHGNFGNVQSLVQKLQSETPKGEAIEVTDETVAELTEDYPQLATAMKAILAKALKGRVGTGTVEAVKAETVPVVAALDTETVRKVVKDDGAAQQIKALDEDHPQWREIVGIVDNAGKYDPKNEFRIWLGKQPAAYQTQINGASTALVISKAIDKFQADKTKKAPVPIPLKNKQRDRIADAVTPKGDGSPPPPTKSSDDEFNEGYRTG